MMLAMLSPKRFNELAVPIHEELDRLCRRYKFLELPRKELFVKLKGSWELEGQRREQDDDEQEWDDDDEDFEEDDEE
jgi:hypothetical protein